MASQGRTAGQLQGCREGGGKAGQDGREGGNEMGKATHEEEVEDKQANGGDDTLGLVARVLRHRGKDGHCGSLTSRRDQHEPPAADALDERDGDEGGEEVGDAVQAREKEGGVL